MAERRSQRSQRLVGEPSINRSPNLRWSGRREVQAEGRRPAMTPRASLGAGHSVKMAHIFRDSHAAWNRTRPAGNSRSSPTCGRLSFQGGAAAASTSTPLGRRGTMIDSDVGPVGDSASPPLKLEGVSGSEDDARPSCSRGRLVIVSSSVHHRRSMDKLDGNSVDMDQPPSPTDEVTRTSDAEPSRTFRLLPDLRDCLDDSLSDALGDVFNSSHASRRSSPSPGEGPPSLKSPRDGSPPGPRLRRVGHLGPKIETPSPGPRRKPSDKENHPPMRIPSKDRRPSVEANFQSSPASHLPPRSIPSSPERVLEQARAQVDRSPSRQGPSTPLLLLPRIETTEELRLSPDVEIYRKDHRPRRNRCRSYFDDDLFHVRTTANTRTPERGEAASIAMASDESRRPRTPQREPGHHRRLTRQPAFCADVDHDCPFVSLE